MNPADEQRLREVFRREYRSLLQYVREAASPYCAAVDRKLLDGVQRVATEEAAALGAFGEFLDAQRVPLPYLGSYPVAFTDLNFVGIRYLLPKLVDEQKADLAALQTDAAALTDPAARNTVAALVDLHRRHLAELGEFGQ